MSENEERKKKSQSRKNKKTLSHLPVRDQQQRVGCLDRLEVKGGLARAEHGVAVERALDGDAMRYRESGFFF